MADQSLKAIKVSGTWRLAVLLPRSLYDDLGPQWGARVWSDAATTGLICKESAPEKIVDLD